MRELPSIGSLEETVLLIVLMMDGKGYGVSIAETYSKRTGKSISIPAVHTVLKRLEGKGMINSSLGESSAKRGGRPKRFFAVTSHGLEVLQAWRKTREGLWANVPLNLLNP